jgi:hypothetical protein
MRIERIESASDAAGAVVAFLFLPLFAYHFLLSTTP